MIINRTLYILFSRRLVGTLDLTYLFRYDHPDVIAGQGTVAIEVLENVPDADYIIVPIGGGGLVAGICVAAKYIKPTIKIIVSKPFSFELNYVSPKAFFCSSTRKKKTRS